MNLDISPRMIALAVLTVLAVIMIVVFGWNTVINFLGVLLAIAGILLICVIVFYMFLVAVNNDWNP